MWSGSIKTVYDHLGSAQVQNIEQSTARHKLKKKVSWSQDIALTMENNGLKYNSLRETKHQLNSRVINVIWKRLI